MKGGVTKRLERTVDALEKGQIKKALILTDSDKTQSQRAIVEQAAHTCMADKKNKEACKKAMDEAKDQVKETITLEIDSPGVEGVEAYLEPATLEAKTDEPVVEPVATLEAEIEVHPEVALAVQPQEVTLEKTDEELYEECEECHVGNAVAQFAVLCQANPQVKCDSVLVKLNDPMTPPEAWVQAMIETAGQAQGEDQAKLMEPLNELIEYLEGRASPILKAVEEGATCEVEQ